MKFLNIFKKSVLTSFVSFFLMLPFYIKAGGLVPCGGDGEPKCQLCHLFVMMDRIFDFIMLELTPVIAVLMITIGGIMLLFAGTKPEMLKLSKSIITSTIIGVVVIYASWIIVNSILTALGVQAWTGLGQWWIIDCQL